MTTKTCTKCGETKTTDQFYKDRASKDGLCQQCKACRAARNRAYYEANREECTAKRRAYWEATREERNAQQRAYHEANRDRENARSRAYYNFIGNSIAERHRAITSRYATRTGEPWTTEEDRYLLTDPGTLMDKALQLSRTYDAVKNRAKRLRQEQAA